MTKQTTTKNNTKKNINKKIITSILVIILLIITSIFVIVGAILSFLGLYDYLREYSLIGSSVPITSFGNALYQAALNGYYEAGFIGMFNNLLSTTSAGISGAIFFGFIFALIFRVKD